MFEYVLCWWSLVSTIIFTFIIYMAYFYKINWIKDLSDFKKIKKGSILAHRKCRKLGNFPPVYPNGWFGLIESDQVKKGEVKHVTALGENFAVFRTEEGVVHILDAYCPHLGANMAEGGRVVGNCLECPFHSWRFRGEDGQCDSIIYSEKVPSIAKTKKWQSCEVNGFVFVWYHIENEEADWQPKQNSKISSGIWRYHGRNEFFIQCHIQEIPENGADVAHLNVVHGPSMFLHEKLPWLARHYWTNACWSNTQSFSNNATKEMNGTSEPASNRDESDDQECKTEKHKAFIRIRHSMVFFRYFTMLSMDVAVEQIGPGYVELYLDTAFGPMLILQTVTPVKPLLQRVIHKIYAPPLIAPYASIVFLAECIMFERDVAIWNQKRFEKKPILVSEDRNIAAYRRWYSQFYSTNSLDYNMAMQTLQW
ncbi:cholesterol 7-desaturase nvd-like [Prorops nasuta]|uniref:cholesterol 7-desaturase nvd-like n=1 Tax=Prorops nasuta TaxID=863751 RepID=UPI0034CE055A